MKKKNILASLIGLLSVSFLFGCGDNNSATNVGTTTGGADNLTDEINIVKNDKLAVDQNKCIGCGRCARVAPDNFEMNSQIRKAQIKSSEIKNQKSVDSAIMGCAPKAITQ